MVEKPSQELSSWGEQNNTVLSKDNYKDPKVCNIYSTLYVSTTKGRTTGHPPGASRMADSGGDARLVGALRHHLEGGGNLILI